jgi:hypothetical protein
MPGGQSLRSSSAQLRPAPIWKCRLCLFQESRIHIPERHGCARGDEALGHGKTEALRATRHDGVLSTEIDAVHAGLLLM